MRINNSYWYEVNLTQKIKGELQAEIKLKYIPLYMIIKEIRKFIGWKIWRYPGVIKYCIDNLGISLESM